MPMKNGIGPQGISVVVPVYNSSVILPLLVKELEAVLPECSNQFELILVNDASPDQSWQIITELARERAWIHGINLIRNVGQHNALLCGIRQEHNRLQDFPHVGPRRIPAISGTFCVHRRASYMGNNPFRSADGTA